MSDDAKGELDALVTVAVFERMAQKVRERSASLERSEAFVREVIDNAADGILTVSSDGIIQTYNPAAEAIFGYRQSDVTGRPLGMLMPQPKSDKHRDYIQRYEQYGKSHVIGAGMVVEGTGRHKDGHLIPLELAVNEMSLDGEKLYIASIRDATRRKQAESELKLAAKVMDTALEAIIITDKNNCIEVVNRAFSEITGYSSHEVVGKDPRMIESGQYDGAFYDEIDDALSQEGTWQGELWVRRKNGEVYPKWMSVSVIRNESDQITHHVAIFSDITERKMSEERLEYLAHYDPLTGLPNRLLFHDRLARGIECARRDNQELALMFLDLDHFKVINDTLGHDVGDELLKQVSQRLKKVVRETDTVARLAGDEFVVMLPDIRSPATARKIAQHIVNALAEPFQLDESNRFTSASIGISIFPQDGDDPKTLLKHADVAMYRAKDHGRNTYQQYNENMSASMVRRLELETQLRKALEQKYFEMYYQPQIDLRDGRIIGLEALLRWKPGGVVDGVMTDEVIQVAEEIGLIHPLGDWVLEDVCRQYQRWSQAGLGEVRIAVNISARQLVNQSLSDRLAQLLERYQVPPQCIELELTESALMEQMERTSMTLAGFKSIGVELSLDDFGTGYSSLSQLKNLPFSTVKIDREFVRDIPGDPDDVEVVRAIIAMSKSLNRSVVAEGVETHEQLACLIEMECDIVQGYLFSRPLPVCEVERLLRGGSSGEAFKFASLDPVEGAVFCELESVRQKIKPKTAG